MAKASSLLAAASLLIGCSSGGQRHADRGSKQWNVLYVLGFASPADTNARNREWATKFEVALASCVGDAGFTWFKPSPPEADVLTLQDEFSSAYATVHGFGISNADVVTDGLQMNANVDRIEALSETEHAALDAVIDGPKGDDGCDAEASAVADASFPTVKDARALQKEFAAAARADTAVGALSTTWRQCMSHAGLPVNVFDPYELRASLTEEFAALPSGDVAAGAAFSTKERGLATESATCWEPLAGAYRTQLLRVAQALSDKYFD